MLQRPRTPKLICRIAAGGKMMKSIPRLAEVLAASNPSSTPPVIKYHHHHHHHHQNSKPNLLPTILFLTLLTCLAISSNNPSLGERLTNLGSNTQIASDRVLTLKSPVSNPSIHRKPKENFDKLLVKVKENTPIRTKLTIIQPSDDTGDALQQNAKFIFELLVGPDKDFFELVVYGHEYAELLNKVNFDYETPKKTYNIVVRAISTYLIHDVEVEVQVVDENDNRPQLEDFYIVFNNYRNHMPTGPIGRVPATDADLNDQLRYRITSGNTAEMIFVNESTGDIQLSPWLNGTTPIRHVFEVLVSDGSNEITAQLVFTSNLVTEVMLQNSVILRLDGIGRDEFLSQKYELFLNSLAKIMGIYSPSDIVVFNVEEFQQTMSPHEMHGLYHRYNSTNLSQSVNISFSIRKNKGDMESYFSTQYLEERIYINRITLAQALDVYVAPFQDNLCTREPCQNYQECQSIYVLDKASKSFLSTKNMLFRTIKIKQAYNCICPPTFTGMKHKSECDLQINQCFSNPCFNGGVCHQHESGYTCECKPDYIGTRCEHSFANSTCQSTIPSSPPSNNYQPALDDKHSMCSGKSVCVDSIRSLTSLVASTNTGFKCEGCQLPQWSTNLCELRARSFSKDSYITLPSLRRRHRFDIRLDFATMERNALLLYNGRYNDKNDFIALEIIDSYLKFSYSLGTTTYSVTLTSVPVSNGDWHKVSVIYRDGNVTLLADDCDPVIDEALAKLQGSFSKRCSNTSYFDQNNAFGSRTLDLSSPMQLGSLPSLPAAIGPDFPLPVVNSFVGCMNDLYIDHRLVDLFNPLYNFRTQPGCPEKPNFCQLHSCNGQPCQEAWGAAKCMCGEDNIGKSCEILINQEKVRKFNGNSYMTFSPIESTVGKTFITSLYFRTINREGVLMKINLDPEGTILLELSDGGLKLTHRSNSLRFNSVKLDDGEWHYVEVVWIPNYTKIEVDHNPHLFVGSSALGDIVGTVIKTVVIGASSSRPSENSAISSEPVADFAGTSVNLPPEDFSSGYFSVNTSSQSFVGCIYGLNVTDSLELWLTSSEERNVERGCFVADACEANPCPTNSRCVRKGINQRTCICNPGFIGEKCLPICDLEPCQGKNSKCYPVLTELSQDLKPQNPGASYKCECELHRSGKNCEHQLTPSCPSHWWGKPVPGVIGAFCGPCDCDESKGFDGECDKVTGQCSCKSDHYQPAGADFCLPCDCYSVGSLKASCDQNTGQCKCREGVVGRRCDSCSSPYAEVTLRGCEVTYNECPKTFSDGIWWDRTGLGRLAVQQCPPSTSIGNATRECHNVDGWLEPNTFDCMSNLFAELYKYDQFFQDNKFPNIKPNVAADIAINLRYALNQTISSPTTRLYGSDMYVSFKLIHHLLQHEVKQAVGLNMTHRQDRLYIRNIVESINYILDPTYSINWPLIAKRSPYGGAGHLLRLLDAYGKALIESQADVFTQPFEISTKYLTFGMDTLSTGQLLAINKGNPLVAPSSPYPPYVSLSTPGLGASEVVSDVASEYLDYSMDKESPSIVIPKYDNYAPNLENEDTITKILIPTKTLHLKTLQELMPPSYYQTKAKARAKREGFQDENGKKQQPAMVVYSIFPSLGPLLPNYHDSSVENRLGLTASANSPVVWLTLRPNNGSDFLSKNIQPKINYVMKMVEPIGKTRPQCAIWNFTPMPGSRDGATNTSLVGRFSTKGCEVKGIHLNHRLRYKYDYVNCSCDHLGAVTVLMDTANYDYLSSENASAKDTSMIIGFSLSIAILIVILFVLTCIRGHSIKSNSNSINKNLIFILIVIESLILYTLASRSSLNQHEYQCKLVAIFLHYFSISLFFWLLVNAIHFYRMLTELRDINHGPMRFYHVFGYAFPAFFVSIAVGLRMEHFGNYLFCWLSIYEPIIWSMFAPVSFVTVLIVILFTLALLRSRYKSVIMEEDPNVAELLKNRLWINLIKTPVIGVHWLMTVYMVNEALTGYAFLFPLVTVVKSIILGLLLCMADKHVRYNLYVSWLRFRGEKVEIMDEAMHYGSHNQWSPSMIGADPMVVGSKRHFGNGFGNHHYNDQVITPGFQSSCTDIFRTDVLALSAASTTSRSSITGTSESAYHQYHQHRGDRDTRDGVYGRTGGERSGRHRSRRHKKSHRHHKHHHHHHHHHHHRSHKSRHQQQAADHQDSHHHQYEHYESRRRATGAGYGETTQRAPSRPDKSISQNDLASSHSSDDASTMHHMNRKSATTANTNLGVVNLGASTSESHLLGAAQQVASGDSAQQPSTSAERHQTVPMELSGLPETASAMSSPQTEAAHTMREDEAGQPAKDD